MFGAMGVHVLRNPNGTYSYVGTVPGDLMFETNDHELIETACKFGSGLARKIAEREGKTFRTRTFITADAAIEFAASKGVRIS